jgi:hypothetical protein
MKEFDHFLNNVKAKHQQSEEKGLINGCLKQWLRFMLFAKVSIFSNGNDFGEHKGIDECKAVYEIRNVKLFQQKHAVGCQGTEEKGQIEKDRDKLDELMGGLLLQADSVGMFSVHLALPFSSTMFCCGESETIRWFLRCDRP